MVGGLALAQCKKLCLLPFETPPTVRPTDRPVVRFMSVSCLLFSPVADQLLFLHLATHLISPVQTLKVKTDTPLPDFFNFFRLFFQKNCHLSQRQQVFVISCYSIDIQSNRISVIKLSVHKAGNEPRSVAAMKFKCCCNSCRRRLVMNDHVEFSSSSMRRAYFKGSINWRATSTSSWIFFTTIFLLAIGKQTVSIDTQHFYVRDRFLYSFLILFCPWALGFVSLIN